MTVEQAREIMGVRGDDTTAMFGSFVPKSRGTTLCFDYLKGRVMKVDLSKDDLDERLYDRDNGSGSAARVIAELRRTG